MSETKYHYMSSGIHINASESGRVDTIIISLEDGVFFPTIRVFDSNENRIVEVNAIELANAMLDGYLKLDKPADTAPTPEDTK